MKTPSMISTLLATLALASACTSAATGDAVPAPSPSASSVSSPPPDEGAVLRCADDDLVDSIAFSGPGWDGTKGALTKEPRASYRIATTVFAYHRDEKRKADFDATLARVIEAAKVSPGLVGYQIAHSSKCGYARTISVWETEDDMMRFVLSGAHSDATTKVRDVGIDGRTIGWEGTAKELPVSWPAARAKLVPTLP